MSVNQETLSTRGGSATEDAPELEYSLVRSDSLAMFGAALGGAVLGMLLTLLVLAIVNGGTLRFTGGERITSLEANVERINENVGAVSFNVDTVAEQLGSVAGSLENLRSEVSSRGAEVDEINAAIATLDVTRQQFDTFVGALSEAITAMQELTGEEDVPATEEAAPAVEEAAPADEAAAAGEGTSAASAGTTMPYVEYSADVPAGDVAVLLFADANANGLLDEGEAIQAGMMATLLDADGAEIASVETSDAGALFEELAAGEYTVSIEGLADVAVTVEEDGEEGQIVYIPVAGE